MYSRNLFELDFVTRKTTRVHHIKKEIFMEFKAFLIKYAEIGIKGNNRRFFEDALFRQMKYARQHLSPQTSLIISLQDGQLLP